MPAHAGADPTDRCLVPANSFAEYAPESNPETKKKDVVAARASYSCAPGDVRLWRGRSVLRPA